MELTNEFESIRDWAESRGLYTHGDQKTQTVKLMEEVGELSKSIIEQNEDETKDAIGDIVVVLVNLAHLSGYKIEDCINGAWTVIRDRKGKMVNNTFKKE